MEAYAKTFTEQEVFQKSQDSTDVVKRPLGKDHIQGEENDELTVTSLRGEEY